MARGSSSPAMLAHNDRYFILTDPAAHADDTFAVPGFVTSNGDYGKGSTLRIRATPIGDDNSRVSVSTRASFWISSLQYPSCRPPRPVCREAILPAISATRRVRWSGFL